MIEYQANSVLKLKLEVLHADDDGVNGNEEASSEQAVDYDKYPNGDYLYELMRRAEPRLAHLSMPNEDEPYNSSRWRLLNLDFILRNIRYCYQVNHVYKKDE